MKNTPVPVSGMFKKSEAMVWWTDHKVLATVLRPPARTVVGGGWMAGGGGLLSAE